MPARGAAPLDPGARWQPAPRRARVWLAALALGLPLAVIGGSLALGWVGETPLALATAAGACLLLFLAIERALRRHRVLLSAGMLEVATTFYTRRLPLADLRIGQARIVDLASQDALRPLLRINGVGLPGFSSGWFLLRDRSRAFVAVADGTRVLWLPTTRGYGLLLQPQRPQVLLEALQAMAGGVPRS